MCVVGSEDAYGSKELPILFDLNISQANFVQSYWFTELCCLDQSAPPSAPPPHTHIIVEQQIFKLKKRTVGQTMIFVGQDTKVVTNQ